MRTRIGTERIATASESRPRRFHSRFISHKTAGSVHSTRRRATRGAGNRDASRPPPSNASHAATIARRDDQASPARVQTRGTHRRRVVALALGVFAEWKRAHGEEFPGGARADVRARLEARAARAVRGLPKHVRFPNAWKPTSAATTRRLAYAVGLDTRARRARARRRSSGKSTPTRRSHVRSVQSVLRRVRAVPHGRTDEDDPSRNHRRQPSTDAREAKGGAWTKSRWTHVVNARGEAPETSRRFHPYCGAALKRAGVAQGVARERVQGERRPTRRERHLLPLPEGREQGEAPRLAHGSRRSKVFRP